VENPLGGIIGHCADSKRIKSGIRRGVQLWREGRNNERQVPRRPTPISRDTRTNPGALIGEGETVGGGERKKRK